MAGNASGYCYRRQHQSTAGTYPDRRTSSGRKIWKRRAIGRRTPAGDARIDEGL